MYRMDGVKHMDLVRSLVLSMDFGVYFAANDIDVDYLDFGLN